MTIIQPFEAIDKTNYRQLLNDNIEAITQRNQDLLLLMSVFLTLELIATYLHRGDIRFLWMPIYNIPEKYRLSDKRYTEIIHALNVGNIGICLMLLFPLL